MLEKEHISKAVCGWIAEEEMPPGPGLKVLKGFDPYAGMDEDEIEAYLDFRHWYQNRDHQLLDLVPVKPFEIYCFEEPDDAISFPFGSIGRGILVHSKSINIGSERSWSGSWISRNPSLVSVMSLVGRTSKNGTKN